MGGPAEPLKVSVACTSSPPWGCGSPLAVRVVTTIVRSFPTTLLGMGMLAVAAEGREWGYLVPGVTACGQKGMVV